MINPQNSPTLDICTPDEIRRFVEATGENDFVDAKGPCSWADNDTKASLSKDIAAFANSPGGGAIVIGKKEADDGTFKPDGLTEDQRTSFETTKVASWVNARFKPAIRLCCHQSEVESLWFVVITIAEFADKPIICTKSYETKTGKPVLVEGTVYIRTAEASSAPLKTPEQLASLVGRAVVKQQGQLREMFDSVLAGHTAKSVPTDEERFSSQASIVEQDLLENSKDPGQGAWKFVIHPDTFEARWPSIEELSSVMQRVSLPPHRFPQEYYQPPSPREWGISGGYKALWGLTNEGLLYVWSRYRENHEAWESPYDHGENKRIEPGGWLDMDSTVHMVADLFVLSQRFAAELDNTTQVRYQVEAGHIKGRHLLRRGVGRNLMDYGHPPCLLETFRYPRYPKTLPAGRLISSWKQQCVDCLEDLFSRFPGGQEHSDRAALERWVDKYTNDVA